MRISGLASGMDIDSIVKDLMKAERLPLDKLKQKKQVLEWKRDDYRSFNTLLLEFRTNDLTSMKMTSKYRVRTTTSTDDLKVSASASSAANNSSYSVSKVEQLASAESQLNMGAIAYDPSKGLYELTKAPSLPDPIWKVGAVDNKSLTVTTDGKDFDLSLLTSRKAGTQSDWSVKVNGRSYKVVDLATWNNATVNNDNNVYIDADGKLSFKNNIAKDSVIKVDYIANSKTDTLKLVHDTTTTQLSRGSINTINSIILKRSKTTGGTTTNEPDVTLTFSNGKVLNGATEVGTIDMESGKITFNSDMNSFLPPNPSSVTDGSVYTHNLEVNYDQNYTTFSVDTHTSKGKMHENFIIQGNDSINSVVNKVNGSNVGASLFYDAQTRKMSLTRTETGDFNQDPTDNFGYEMLASGKFVTDILQFHVSKLNDASLTVAQKDAIKANITEAKNAKFVMNGLSTERSSNTFEISGVTFTLKQTFDQTLNPLKISVNNDAGEVVENIKEFINKYNEIIGKIQSKLNEDRYRTFTPLTDEQREQLSDKQQEQWEEKAKSGLLRKDSVLSTLLSDMRLDFYQPVLNDRVATEYKQLTNIGIKTTAIYTEGGKLEIDEAKLRKALEEDPQSVENLFKGDGITESQKGIVNRLYDSVIKTMDLLKEKAGNKNSTNQQFVIGKELDDVGKRIDRFEDRMKQVEDRYWRQFTAMETAIQRANQQSSYFMQQLGGGM